MSVGESLGSHSLHSFAEFLQHHINSPEASSCLTSRRKTFIALRPFSLNFMAPEKSARKGGRQRRGNTSIDLPPDLYELYKTDPEEDYNQRKTWIQWIRRYWAKTMVQVQVRDPGVCWEESHQMTMGRHSIQKSSTQVQSWSHWTRLLSLHGLWTAACGCRPIIITVVPRW